MAVCCESSNDLRSAASSVATSSSRLSRRFWICRLRLLLPAFEVELVRRRARLAALQLALEGRDGALLLLQLVALLLELVLLLGPGLVPVGTLLGDLGPDALALGCLCGGDFGQARRPRISQLRLQGSEGLARRSASSRSTAARWSA